MEKTKKQMDKSICLLKNTNIKEILWKCLEYAKIAWISPY